jgi:DNA repair protein RadA/Sms
VSSLSGVTLPADCVYFGEISLSGAVRPVAQAAARLKEAERLGFDRAVLPGASLEKEVPGRAGARGLVDVAALVADIAAAARPQLRSAAI